MLMQALVRTPDQHDPVTTRAPLLKSSIRTCLLVAGLQELATTPGKRECVREASGQTRWVSCQEKAGQCYRGSSTAILFIIVLKTVGVILFLLSENCERRRGLPPLTMVAGQAQSSGQGIGEKLIYWLLLLLLVLTFPVSAFYVFKTAKVIDLTR